MKDFETRFNRLPRMLKEQVQHELIQTYFKTVNRFGFSSWKKHANKLVPASRSRAWQTIAKRTYDSFNN